MVTRGASSRRFLAVGGEVPGFPNQSRAPTRAGLRTSPHPLGLGELPPRAPRGWTELGAPTCTPTPSELLPRAWCQHPTRAGGGGLPRARAHPPLALELGQAPSDVVHGHLEELIRQLRRPGLKQHLQVGVAHHGGSVHRLGRQRARLTQGSGRAPAPTPWHWGRHAAPSVRPRPRPRSPSSTPACLTTPVPRPPLTDRAHSSGVWAQPGQLASSGTHTATRTPAASLFTPCLHGGSPRVPGSCLALGFSKVGDKRREQRPGQGHTGEGQPNNSP